MRKKQTGRKAGKQHSQRPSESVVKEAWDNMSDDFNKLMPEKFRDRQDKKKFVLWLFILELVVLGVIGKFIYEWWVG